MMIHRIIQGDVLESLRGLPDQSVHCIITSPPYYLARDYQTGEWVGGDPKCDHRSPTMREGRNEDRPIVPGSASTNNYQFMLASHSACGKCGAIKVDRQIGLEQTPEEYVDKMTGVFMEAYRVLRDDGVLWLNLGDTYANNGMNAKKYYQEHPEHHDFHSKNPDRHPVTKAIRGGRYKIKAKELIGIPWLVALALREAGWYLRQDCIWAKSNPMRNPARDRCCSSHEYVFLLTKRGGDPSYWVHRDRVTGTRSKPKPDYRWTDHLENREYTEKPEAFNKDERIPCPDCQGMGIIIDPWFGAEAVCGRCEGEKKIRRWKRINLWQGHDYFFDSEAIRTACSPLSKPEENYTGKSRKSYSKNRAQDASKTKSRILKGQQARLDQLKHCNLRKQDGTGNPTYTGFNDRYEPKMTAMKLDVWVIPTQACPKAHFATFPRDLIIDPIKAGTSEAGCCPACGAPRERVTRPSAEYEKLLGKSYHDHSDDLTQGMSQEKIIAQVCADYETVGWAPTCECGLEETVPCVVMDLFGGTGTVTMLSRDLGRSSVTIDLSPKYIAMIKDDLRINEQLETGLVRYIVEEA